MQKTPNKEERSNENSTGAKPGNTATPGAGGTNAPDLSRTIEKLAYELWLRRGGVHGDDWSDWFEAEKLL